MSDTTLPAMASRAPALLTDPLYTDRGSGVWGKLTVADILSLGQRRNLLINGCFDVAQRGTSYVATITGAYGCVDRWYMGQQGTAQATFSQASAGLQGFSKALKLLLTGTSTGTAYFGQIIESVDVTRYQGRNVTLAVRAIKGSTFNPANVSAQISTGTGTDEGSASFLASTWTGSTTPLSSSFAPTTAWATYTLPNVAIPANATEMAVQFSAAPTGAAVDGNSYLMVTGIEVVDSTVAQASFTPRPFAEELALCQRYYERWSHGGGGNHLYVGIGRTSATTAAEVVVGFAPKRAVPTFGSSPAADFLVQQATSSNAASALSMTATPNRAAISVTTSGLTAGDAVNLLNTNTGDYVEFKAEL